MNIIRKASRYLFVICMIDKVYKCLANVVRQSEQCDSFLAVKASESRGLDSGGSINEITFWDSDGNLFTDERFWNADDGLYVDEGFGRGLCFDSEKCYHVFLDGAGVYEVFLKGTLSEEGRFNQAGRLFRVGRKSCLQKPKCKTGHELFIFAVDDYKFSLKSSEGIVDEGHVTDRKGKNKDLCMDLTLTCI